MNYTVNDNPKIGEKSSEVSESVYDNSTLQSTHEKENTIFISQLRELARHFSSIENNHIRQYAINLVKEIAKRETEEKAKDYMDEMLS